MDHARRRDRLSCHSHGDPDRVLIDVHAARGRLPVHPGRVRQWGGSHGKLEPVPPDTSRFTGPKVADGIAAPAAPAPTSREPASDLCRRTEVRLRSGRDQMARAATALFTDMQRPCQEVDGRDRPCATPNRRFLAKPSVGGDRGDRLRGAAAGGADDVANCPLRRQPAVAANRSAAAYSHPAQPQPCAVCRHRLPVVHRCPPRPARRGRGSPVLHGLSRQRAGSSWRCCSWALAPRPA